MSSYPRFEQPLNLTKIQIIIDEDTTTFLRKNCRVMKRKEREVACCHGNQGKTKLLCSLLKEPYYMVSSIHSSTEHIV